MADGSRVPAPIPAMPAELMIWLSPAFPTGAFAFSHGLERLVEAGAVHEATTLEAWLSDLARIGSLRNDLILVAATWRAAAARDPAAIEEVAELAAALAPTAERQLETLTQGRAFAEAIATAWACPTVRSLQTRHGWRLAYPVAVGAAASDRGIDLGATLGAYAIAFATNLVSAAVRLGIIGQFDGQRVLAALMPRLADAAAAAQGSTLDNLGGAMPASDIASIEHETQYTRLFRS